MGLPKGETIAHHDSCNSKTVAFYSDDVDCDRTITLVPKSTRAGYSASEKAISQMTTNSHAEQTILRSIRDREIYFCDGELDEFIEAAKSLGFDYDYRKTKDGFDFMTWHPDDEEEVARIKL